MRRILVTLLLSTATSTGYASDDPTESMNAERDALILKIAEGKDTAASVRRFAEMVRARDKIVATSAAALAQKRVADDAERKERTERRETEQAYRKTADYEVATRCTLSPDPAHPLPSTEGRYRADWGKVTRKEKARLPPKNALDDGEEVQMYEVAGAAGKVQFRGEKFTTRNSVFEASVGDLVLVCTSGSDTTHGVPAGWGPRILGSGFAARLAEPPLVVKKARWNAIHVTDNAFFWAVRRVEWKFPDETFLLASLQVDKDAGNGRWEIGTNNRAESFLIEVPPSLKHANLLKSGKQLWFVLGHHRFDRALKKLVLVAEDIEERYIHEK